MVPAVRVFVPSLGEATAAVFEEPDRYVSAKAELERHSAFELRSQVLAPVSLCRAFARLIALVVQGMKSSHLILKGLVVAEQEVRDSDHGNYFTADSG